MSEATEYISLLKKLVSIPSISTEEDKTAGILADFFEKKGVATQQIRNNVVVRNKHIDTAKPTILMCSHHDTVKPNTSWSTPPFEPLEKDGKIFGLGTNDAGASLVSMICAFMHFYHRDDLKYNIVLVCGAEEEISGKNGVECVIPTLPPIDFAIVGEPTTMQMAIAEKGLMVLDCVSHGIPGHAARNEGENALYNAIDDIHWFRNYEFVKTSEMLGPINMNVTIIQAGSQHNVVPDKCTFTVDVRSTDAYSNEEILEIIKGNVKCDVKERSTRLQPSGIPQGHVIVKAGKKLGLTTYGSPTLSDQALMPFPSLKIGPGDSARSHTADEYIYISEIEEGIDIYIKLIDKVC